MQDYQLHCPVSAVVDVDDTKRHCDCGLSANRCGGLREEKLRSFSEQRRHVVQAMIFHVKGLS